MGDSPLSITASVTGILTFIAAILGFIYVRYTTLRNSNEELMEILNSVLASLEETRKISPMERGSVMGLPFLEGETEMHMLVVDFYKIEIDILGLLCKVFGAPPILTEHISAFRNLLENTITHGNRTIAEPIPGFRDLRQSMIAEWNRTEDWSGDNPSLALLDTSNTWAMIWTVMFGSSNSVRWYRMRKKAIKLVQDRETLRSRLLFHQIFMINREVQSQTINARTFEARVQAFEARAPALEIQIYETHKNHARVEAHIENLSDFSQSEIRVNILRWISPYQYQQDQNEIIARLAQGTCAWIYEHEAFLTWQTASGSSILWICGASGTGKSTIIASLIDHYQQKYDNGSSLNPSFFYCSEESQGGSTAREVLASILRQLCTTRGPIPVRVVSLYEFDRTEYGFTGGLHISNIVSLIRARIDGEKSARSDKGESAQSNDEESSLISQEESTQSDKTESARTGKTEPVRINEAESAPINEAESVRINEEKSAQTDGEESARSDEESVLIIIDGLNALETNERDLLLETLKEIMVNSSALVKVLLSTQPDSYFRRSSYGAARIDLNPSIIKADIGVCIGEVMKRYERRNSLWYTASIAAQDKLKTISQEMNEKEWNTFSEALKSLKEKFRQLEEWDDLFGTE